MHPRPSTISFLGLLLLVGLSTQQLYNWTANVEHNNLFMEWQIDDSVSNDDKRKIVLARYKFVSMTENSTTKNNGYFLIWRNIPADGWRGRAVYMVTPVRLSDSKGNTGQGYDVMIGSSQPIITRLLQGGEHRIERVDDDDNYEDDNLEGNHSIKTRRKLAWTETNINNKTVSLSTQVFELDATSPIKYLFTFHLFGIVYWFVTVYLIFIHPFFDTARKSVRIFWVGHYAFYYQLICVLGGMSTFFYFELDYLQSLLNISQLRFFGMDFNLWSTYEERSNRFAVYTGKFSNLVQKPSISSGTGFELAAEDPLIFCRQFPQMVIYLLATIMSLIPGGMKDTFVSMRLACTVCFSVQLVFRGTYSIFHYFGKSSDGLLGILSLIFGIIFILLPIADSFIMLGQASSLSDKKTAWTVPKAKGALIFDIVGYSGHKKYRDYYPFFVTEFLMGLLLSISIAAFSWSSLIQNIALAVFCLMGIIGIVMNSQHKGLMICKLLLNIALLGFIVLAFIVDWNPKCEVDSAKTFVLIGKILIGFMLCWNVCILIYRLIDLHNDAESTIGEKAKPIPMQKIKANRSK